MKAVTVLALVFLAGAATTSQVQYNRPGWLPDWVPSLPEEWGVDVGSQLPENPPDWWPTDVDWSTVTLPEIVAWASGVVEHVPKIWEFLVAILPGLSNLVLPPWFPPALPEFDIPELPNIAVADIINSLNKPVPGVPTAIQSYPSTVQIEYGIDGVWAQACVGSLITNYHVISSGRCLNGFNQPLKNRRVRAGATQRYGSGSIHEFGSFILHPSYGNIKENFLDGDIGLGRLYAPVEFSNAINTVQIVVQGYQIPDNYPLALVGWAGTAEGSTSFSNRDLYSINLEATNKASCVDRWSGLAVLSDRVKISDNMFCAGRPETNGRDAHMRDIGAPIFSYNILVGVMSFGHYFGDQAYPIVGTSVSSYTSWILANAV